MVAAAALCTYVAIRLWAVVLMLAFALVLMSALLPWLNWMVSRGIPRIVAMLIALLGPVIAVALLLPLVVPSLISEFADLDTKLPFYASEVDRLLMAHGLDLRVEAATRRLDLSHFSTGPAALVNEPVLFGFASAVTVIVLTGYLLADLPRLSSFVYEFVPRGREAEVQSIAGELRRVVGGYVRGQAITSIAIAVFTLAVLVAVRAPNPFAFAAIAAVSDIIPLVGGFIAVVPAAIATLSVSVDRALIVLVCLVLYQQFEDRVLLPRVYASTLHLPTLVVFIVVLAGAELLGVVGVLLALPAVAAGRVLIAYASRHPEALPPGRDELYAPDE